METCGYEWSFGFIAGGGTGVFACMPKQCNLHHYRCSVSMGEMTLDNRQARAVTAAPTACNCRMQPCQQ